MKQYKLLNPGPACTTSAVKESMISVGDVCPREIETIELMEDVSTKIKTLLTSDIDEFECTLLTSSGTGSVEMVISSLPKDASVLNVINGAYGQRIKDMLDVYNISCTNLDFGEGSININDVKECLESNLFTHICIVHCETTTGIINPLKQLCMIAKESNTDVIVDAMSSAFAYPIDVKEYGISYLCCSSNKLAQGMAGLGMVIVDKKCIPSLYPRTVYLDLKGQTEYFAKTGQMRFTPPVQIINALDTALNELIIETVKGRYERYKICNEYIFNEMEKLGFKSLIPREENSIIISSFIEPADFDFESFHHYLKGYGYVIYPGKVSTQQTFRLSNIGDLKLDDITHFIKLVKNYVNITTRIDGSLVD